MSSVLTSLQETQINAETNNTIYLGVSRRYTSDLLNNLQVKEIKNPNYICKQFQNVCDVLNNQEELQQCRKSWNKICINLQ